MCSIKKNNLKKIKNNAPKVAVVYHFWAHYREPIVRLMCQQKSPEPEYTIFSGKASCDGRIKTIDPSNSVLSADEGGLRWYFLKNIWLFSSKIFLWQRGVFKLAWSKEFHVIIFLGNMYIISTWVAALISRLRGKRVLMWTHGFIRYDRGIKGMLRKLFYRLSHGILLYGNFARNMMIGMGFDSNKLYVVYNSLDYHRQFSFRNKLTEAEIIAKRSTIFENPDLPILLFVGRLTPQKQLHMLIDALKILMQSEHRYSVNVLFVGDGPERSSLEQSLRIVGLSAHVHFYGACYDEDQLAGLIAASDLCVAPGEVGLTAIHSLSYGTPVLTHDDPFSQMPEFESIIKGKNGSFYRKGDVFSLVNAIQEWFEQNPNREVVRKRCYEMIDKFYNPNYQLMVINDSVVSKKPFF